MARALKMATIVFGMVYVFALVVYVIGTFGLFGQDRDPLSGVFLVPLGLPWNHLIDSFPEPSWPWLAAGAPLINLSVFFLLYWLAEKSLARAR